MVRQDVEWVVGVFAFPVFLQFDLDEMELSDIDFKCHFQCHYLLLLLFLSSLFYYFCIAIIIIIIIIIIIE